MPCLIKDSNNRSPYWIAVCSVKGKQVWRTTKVPIEPLAGRDERADGSLPSRKEMRSKAEEVARTIERVLRMERDGTATEANLRRIFNKDLEHTESKTITRTH